MRRHLAAAAVAASIVFAMNSGCSRRASQDEAPAADAGSLDSGVVLDTYDFGGDFELTDHKGERFTLADHRGKVELLFFGYTFCPDVCPITMSKISRVYTLLGEAADRVETLFVSVDVKRDTPQVLNDYVHAFDYEPIGLTGTEEEVAAVAHQYKAAFEIEPASDSAAGYLVSHATWVYLIDQQGRLRYIFSHISTPEQIADGVRQLMAAPPPRP